MTEAGAVVENLSLDLGAFALKNLDLRLEGAEILVVLGPNGAGKTVCLEAIAGFHRCRSGHILIHGRDVTRLAPERRNVGLLFQDFGLFPHLTVAQNIGFGLHARLRAREAPESARAPRALPELLADFGIAHLATRRPEALSPGEKQRVALARALATHPDLYLFDEPFSALDARTRDELRGELRRFLRDIRVPAIFVTHDYADALALADEVAVMREGALVQSGKLEEIFRRPANRFVAEFIGIENILAGRLAGQSAGRAVIAVADKTLLASAQGPSGGEGRELWLCIKADDVELALPGDERAPRHANVNRLAADIVARHHLGVLTKVELDCGFRLNAYVMTRQVGELNLVPGARVEVGIAAEAIHLLPRPSSAPD
jgi:molybdate/tungstate transport system ATP-binding protein